MMMTKRVNVKHVTTHFFTLLLYLVVYSTSNDYGAVVLRSIKKKLIKEYPFFKYVEIRDKAVKVDFAINTVSKQQVGKLFKSVMGMISSDFLKLYLQQRLDKEDLEFFDEVGLRLSS